MPSSGIAPYMRTAPPGPTKPRILTGACTGAVAAASQLVPPSVDTNTVGEMSPEAYILVGSPGSNVTHFMYGWTPGMTLAPVPSASVNVVDMYGERASPSPNCATQTSPVIGWIAIERGPAP